MKAPRHRLVVLLATAGLLLAACAAPPPPPVAPQMGGRELFVRYCASCHGTEGRGDGPAAGALQPPPNDLTRLTERFGKADILPEIMASIDGRRPVRAHGGSGMPVWGESFEAELRQSDRAYPATTTLRREQLIADYLVTLQAK
jgi:mono/diheme cytochrome c family protein